MNVLVVDNNRDILEALSDYFTLQGIDCEVASDGIRGLFKIQEKDYDLIFLDMAMPDYWGYDILNQLKKQNLQEKNIVVITATGLKKNDFDEYIEVGVKEVISKPTELSLLEVMITKYGAISKKQMH